MLVLIINADDWGRSAVETDTALECHLKSRVTAVSAMVFMRDSQRAARVARDHGIDVGLHINFSQQFDQPDVSPAVQSTQARVMRFVQWSRFSIALYNPFLRESFIQTFTAQWDEFVRLYGAPPSHLDGHQHRHLCGNMLVDGFIPAGLRLRRNFTYARGERGMLNRAYRQFIDRAISRRYRLTDAFYSLGEALARGRILRVIDAAREGTVELMVHPVHEAERDFLLSDEFTSLTVGIELRSFARL
jgi:predicted glycoside hydrolase/deacetylase ChbG (UPF0249 family)